MPLFNGEVLLPQLEGTSYKKANMWWLQKYHRKVFFNSFFLNKIKTNLHMFLYVNRSKHLWKSLWLRELETNSHVFVPGNVLFLLIGSYSINICTISS